MCFRQAKAGKSERIACGPRCHLSPLPCRALLSTSITTTAQHLPLRLSVLSTSNQYHHTLSPPLTHTLIPPSPNPLPHFLHWPAVASTTQPRTAPSIASINPSASLLRCPHLVLGAPPPPSRRPLPHPTLGQNTPSVSSKRHTHSHTHQT